LTEFIGTFFLVFTICCTVQANAALAPLAIGLVLAAMIYAGGHVSGGHYNPAVSLAVFLRGRLAARDLGPYIAAQAIGAITAAAVAGFVIGTRPDTTLNLSGRPLAAAFIVEALVTFALAFVVLNTATSKDHPNNSFYGLAIGATVLAGAVAVGGISGGVFNPAVAVAVSAAGMVSWSMLWVYMIANFLGGAVAAVAFRVLSPADHAVPEPTGETAQRVVTREA
jgi:aquaporin Z